MIKVFVFDTNSLISAHLLPSSINTAAYDKAFENGVMVRSEETFAEFVEVFTRQKFDKYISLEKRLAAIEAFERKSLLVAVSTDLKACRDPKDDKFLSLAVTINADCLISGDQDLLVLNPFRNIPILNAPDFLRQF